MGLRHLSTNDIGNTIAAKATNEVLGFPAPSGGKITLAANTCYKPNGTEVIGTNYIEMAENSCIIGTSGFISKIVYTGTGAAIRGTDVTVSIQNITVASTTAGGTAFNFVNTAKTKVFFVKQVLIANQDTKSVIDGYNIQYIGITNFVSTSMGLECKGGNYLYLNQLGFDASNTGTFISIPSGSWIGGQIIQGTFNVASGSTAVNLNSSATFSSVCLVQGNIFTGAGTRMTGHNPDTYFDVEYKSNSGLANTVAAISYYWGNNSGTYTQNGNAYSKITGGTSVALNQLRFTHTSPNRADYKGKKPIKVKVNVACTLDYDSGSAYIGDIAVFKNGVYVASSVNGLTVYANEEPTASNLQISLVQNDYIEIYSYKYGAGNQTVKATFLNVQINEIS